MLIGFLIFIMAVFSIVHFSIVTIAKILQKLVTVESDLKFSELYNKLKHPCCRQLQEHIEIDLLLTELFKLRINGPLWA